MHTNVLIVGAGPTGLSLALSLLRNGLSVRIIEKQPQFHLGERGSGIQSRTLEVYKFLGILPDVIEQSTTSPRNLQYYSAPDDGKPPRLAPISELTDDTPARPLNNGRMLGQSRHEELLRRHILSDYGCQVELGMELLSFEQTQDHVVANVTRTIISEQVQESITVDWLVGADGAHSVVRRQLGLSFLGESPPAVEAVTGDIYVVGDSVLKQDHVRSVFTQFSTLTLHLSAQRMANLGPSFSRRGFIATMHGTGEFNFYVLSGSEGTDLDVVKASSSREELIKLIHDYTGRRDIEFGELVWMGLWRPNIRMVDSFGRDRVFVAGDAAHVHSPTGGQGMNSGVQDSFNLAWKLALVHKGLAPKSLLGSYSQERLPVIATMLDKTTELFRNEFQGKIGQRQSGMFRGYELRQLGVNYRGSPFVVDERYTADKDEIFDPYRSGDDGTLHGGDRAPDAPSLAGPDGETTTLFDIFSAVHHTALIFPGLAGKAFSDVTLETLREYPEGIVKNVLLLPATGSSSGLADTVLVDSGGYAYANYIVAQDTPTVIIVRPDSYIGALVTSGRTGICNYFTGILSR